MMIRHQGNALCTASKRRFDLGEGVAIDVLAKYRDAVNASHYGEGNTS